jgi:hypothetical protein
LFVGNKVSKGIRENSKERSRSRINKLKQYIKKPEKFEEKAQELKQSSSKKKSIAVGISIVALLSALLLGPLGVLGGLLLAGYLGKKAMDDTKTAKKYSGIDKNSSLQEMMEALGVKEKDLKKVTEKDMRDVQSNLNEAQKAEVSQIAAIAQKIAEASNIQQEQQKGSLIKNINGADIKEVSQGLKQQIGQDTLKKSQDATKKKSPALDYL